LGILFPFTVASLRENVSKSLAEKSVWAIWIIFSLYWSVLNHYCHKHHKTISIIKQFLMPLPCFCMMIFFAGRGLQPRPQPIPLSDAIKSGNCASQAVWVFPMKRRQIWKQLWKWRRMKGWRECVWMMQGHKVLSPAWTRRVMAWRILYPPKETSGISGIEPFVSRMTSILLIATDRTVWMKYWK